jgi:hypothetical protein
MSRNADIPSTATAFFKAPSTHARRSAISPWNPRECSLVDGAARIRAHPSPAGTSSEHPFHKLPTAWYKH